MEEPIVWDRQAQCLHVAAQDQPLQGAALRCFRHPGPEALATLESTLAPTGLMRQCAVVLQTANAVLDEEGQQLAAIFTQQGKPIICTAGCARCCQQLVLCRPFEARLIQAFLEAHPATMQAFAHAYTLWDAATAPLRQSYLAWAQAFYGKGEDDGSHKVEDYQTPCPFLNQEGCCAIYPVRPYACRTCIALDPACPAPPPEHNGLLYMQYSLYTSHHASRQAVIDLLLRRLHLPDADAQPVPMPEMVARCCQLALR